MTEKKINIYEREYPDRIIKILNRDEIHRTYGGELYESDFNQCGNVIRKIIRAKSFDKMCAANNSYRKARNV